MGEIAIKLRKPFRKRFVRRLGIGTVEGRQNWWALLFVAPAVAFLIVFKFYPMLWAAQLSLYDYDLVRYNAFLGLGNYINLMHNRDFLRSLWNSTYYVAGSVVPIWFLSLGLALVFVQRIPGRDWLRLAYFIPVIMASIVIAVIWKFLYHPYGLVNALLQHIGFGQINWLTNSRTAMPALIFIGIWRGTPYFMILFLAGLQAIPQEFYDAARVDGASGLRIFWHITLPLLKPTILLVIVMAVIIGIKVFLNPLVMTHGGPCGATLVLPLLIYRTGFEYFKMGEASAMSMVLFAIVMVFTVIQIRLFTYEE